MGASRMDKKRNLVRNFVEWCERNYLLFNASKPRRWWSISELKQTNKNQKDVKLVETY